MSELKKLPGRPLHWIMLGFNSYPIAELLPGQLELANPAIFPGGWGVLASDMGTEIRIRPAFFYPPEQGEFTFVRYFEAEHIGIPPREGTSHSEGPQTQHPEQSSPPA